MNSGHNNVNYLTTFALYISKVFSSHSQLKWWFIVFPQVLLKRGSAKEGQFLHAPTGSFDNDLFTIIWGPTVAALSFVFDKSVEDTIIQRAIAGFR